MSSRKRRSEQARFRDGKIQRQRQLADARRADSKVECLGMTFNSEAERREHFLDILREKLKEPEFRKTPGFPMGSDEAILRLSDPPYYTACPNPFLEQIVTLRMTKGGVPNRPQTPYWADITKSRNEPFVNAHSYATKVPPEIVLHYVLHYTQPGDVVYDGYCGTGMTGVATQLAASPPEELRQSVERDFETAQLAKPEWGQRTAILGDLSPAATFIAANLTASDDLSDFATSAGRIMEMVNERYGWMYKTRHTDGRLADIDVTLWSDVFLCPTCTSEVIFWDAAVDMAEGELREKFPCTSCGAELTKRQVDRVFTTVLDDVLNRQVKLPKQVPVRIVYHIEDEKSEKTPDEEDLALMRRIVTEPFPAYLPRIPMMHKGAEWGDTWRAGVHAGISHLHHLYTRRNLISLSYAWSLADTNRLRFMLTALMYKSSLLCGPLLSNFFAERLGKSRGGWVGKERSGTLFRPSISSEVPIHLQIGSRARSVAIRARYNNQLAIQTRSASWSGLPSDSVDYIFVDPPFGANRYYSELNFLWEAWLGVFTSAKEEAVVSPAQHKGLMEYYDLMLAGFRECYRILKPGNWMTVEFSNTSANVWNVIQSALVAAGMVVADVRTLSKGQGSINAYTTPTAVKQDLVISAYKPPESVRARLLVKSSSVDTMWEFAKSHLQKIPVFVQSQGRVHPIQERQAHLLYDRGVALHLQRGLSIPMSKQEFVEGLDQRFPRRDGMYFLPEQVGEYDRKRRTVKEVVQLQIIVTEEASAIQWLHQELSQKPQTFQELHPKFMRELAGWQEYETPIELLEILRENFVKYDGDGEVPASIHAYVSTNFHEFRNLPANSPELQSRAQDRWYVPDPRKASDLERIRERELLKEFATITSAKGRIRQLRTEAARAGFKALWEQADYKAIVDVASKLPTNVVEEDPHLLMYFDLARSRLG